jgi:NADH-quinone oxidoreductase subunit E
MAEPLSSTGDDRMMSFEEAEQLRAQIRKWQQRLPRVAAAMRQRSDALVAAQREIRRLRAAQSEENADEAAARAHGLERELQSVRAAAHSEIRSLRTRNRQLCDALHIANAQLERAGHRIRELTDCISARSEAQAMPATPVEADPLTGIKGIGGKLAAMLREAGVGSLAALAALDLDALEDTEHPLYGLRGRIRRDNWVGQAQALSGR